MFKSKALNVTMFTMIGLIVISVGLYFYVSHAAQAKSEPPTVSEIVKNLSVSTDEITTNLRGNKFIKISFLMQVSNKAAKDELTKRQFQVNNAILYLLSDKTEQELQGKNGMNNMETDLKNKLNGLMKSGKVVHVYTTEKIIQ